MKRLNRLLIANRGEIALRVLRAANELNIKTVALKVTGDENALHVASADHAIDVPSYNSSAAIVEAAVAAGCDAIHPGYGFLSENAEFARQCEDAEITFVGPHSSTIALLGDKVAARSLAIAAGVPVAKGSDEPCPDARAVRAAMAAHGVQYPIFLKAVGGGGGRGMRPVRSESELDEAFAACMREAAAVGLQGGLFVEEMITAAKHVEVQLLGDAHGGLVHLFERDCSVQRRRQKVIEVAPAAFLDEETRELLTSHALRIGEACGYRGAGTCEFLLPATPSTAASGASVPLVEPLFLEFNPRIQVEHTVTEEVTGVDLVAAQLQIASGASLNSLGLEQKSIRLLGSAMQARISLVAPGGTVSSYREPGGAGVRVDSALYAGYTPNASFDPLLLKLIARGGGGAAPTVDAAGGDGAWGVARRRLHRACSELHLGELKTNLHEVRAILSSDAFARGDFTTATLDDGGLPGLSESGAEAAEANSAVSALLGGGDGGACGGLGAKASASPPGSVADGRDTQLPPAPPGCTYVLAPMQGQVLEDKDGASHGVVVDEGGTVVVISSMKMEHAVTSPRRGVVVELLAFPGSHVQQGEPLALIRHSDDDEEGSLGGLRAAHTREEGVAATESQDSRPDLDRMLAARDALSDEGRVAAGDTKFAERRSVRHTRGQLTARENIAALLDDSSALLEFGRFAVAAQSGRAKSIDELRKRTPADGLVCGIGEINAETFGRGAAKTAVAAYDATVLAGTQGYFNHLKLDRILEVADAQRLPFVLYAEGGGGRPGDTDIDPLCNSQLAVGTFARMGRLSGRVPTVGLASGFCFAGNAALLGACDVIIATRGANIGMAGPAMIEGGGLGRVPPTAIGPAEEGATNGTVDILVETEAEAAQVARRYLAFFQGRAPPDVDDADKAGWRVPDQTALRYVVPTNRKRTYDVRRLITTLSDECSWLELRQGFARGVVSGLCRVEGHTLGVLANSADGQLGGAIDSDGALKASRFMELCDAFDLPLLFLCDTPGFMVGVEHEKTSAVRKLSRMFSVASSLSVPRFTIVTRKAYGLGAMAMMGGQAVGHHNAFHVSWPTAEAGPMNLEGAVALGFAKELASAAEAGGASAQQALFDKLLAAGYERGSALSVARTLETDDVIDPAESRAWILSALDAASAKKARTKDRKRPCVSPW